MEQEKLQLEQKQNTQQPTPEQHETILSRVINGIGSGLIRLVVGISLFVGTCGFVAWLFFGGSNDAAPATGSTFYAQPAMASGEADDNIGYGTEQDAGDNCETDDVMPIYRNGQIAGYACVVARY